MEHLRRHRVLEKGGEGGGVPATRNETERGASGRIRKEGWRRGGTGNGRDGRVSTLETLLRRKACNVAAMRARFDTSRRAGVNRVAS